MTEHIVIRPKGIEKFLEPLPGNEHQKRLRVEMKYVSAPIAGKVMTGE